MKRALYYILDAERHPVPAELFEWGEFFEHRDRRVDYTNLDNGVSISTVFLGINHRLFGNGPLFETMIFGGPHDQYTRRYSSWDDAAVGHERAVRLAQEAAP